MIPVDDVAAESVYRKVAEAICLRLEPPAPVVRVGLRVRWLGDGGSGWSVGETPREGLLWDTKAACEQAWERWWREARTSLPPCREPTSARPCLVNADNRIVGLLADDALA